MVQPSEHGKTVTRQELFHLVWRVPIERLAVEFGITGRGLSKICRRLDVPCPPRGYWAKPAVVRKDLAPRRRSDGQGARITVTIKPTRARQRKVAAPLKVKVPLRFRKPHPIIKRWLDQHEAARRRYLDEWRPWIRQGPKPQLSDLDRRRLRILDGLFKALETTGGSIGDDGESFILEDRRIRFRLYERSRMLGRGDYESTGLLKFVALNLSSGLRSEWIESPHRPLETHLPVIAGALVKGASK